MKKKCMYISLFLFIFFAITIRVSAACPAAEQSELNALAGNVKPNVVPKTREEERTIFNEDTGESETQIIQKEMFAIELYNLTEDMYLKVRDGYSNKENTYYYSDVKDGVLTIDSIYYSVAVKYEIRIYASSASCNNTLLRQIEVTTPLLNPYQNYGFCNDAPDYYLCQPYLTSDPNFTIAEAKAKVTEYIESKKKAEEEEEKNNSFWSKLGRFLSCYGLWILGGVLLIGAIGGYVFVTIRRRRIV